ncbi:ABC transporter permease [Streptomyces sp. PLAI1-29]|uniref:ABC transporter permease n=1 Tax=Streptomyces zingiberis TaxID=2053010 RepID=A0ABX1C144_9ACTN|nr:ABC transporter permease [Streptomyces zingiberis]
MGALGRAEFILLQRNRTSLFMALLMPLGMVGVIRSSAPDNDLSGTGLNPGSLALSGGIGAVLLFVVYSNLVAAYVARREELVLKRLRTGEPADLEILAGTALPVAVLAFAQSALLVAAGTLLLDLTAPERPVLLLAGLVGGVLVAVLLATATSAFTRTVESAQVTALPLLLLSFVGSGMVIPVDLMPDRVANVFAVLPFSPVMDLVRTGWLGGGDGGETVRSLLLVVAWTAVGVVATRRWFRWEPRR